MKKEKAEVLGEIAPGEKKQENNTNTVGEELKREMAL